MLFLFFLRPEELQELSRSCFLEGVFPSQAYAAQVMHGQVRWVLWWQKKYGLYLARHRQGYPVASRLRLRSEKMNEAQRACD